MTYLTSSTFRIAGERSVRRLGFGAMHLPTKPESAWETSIAVARRAVELGVTLIDTAHLYRRAAIVVLMTALTFGATKLLQRAVILYGKRLFAAVVLTGVLFQTTLFLFIQQDYPLLFAYQTLGFVVPGLIAYQLVRQPPVPTLLATGTVSFASYGVLASGVLVGLVPTI